MKIALFASVLTLLAGQSFAQDKNSNPEKDARAKQILDEVSKKTRSYTSFSVEFTSTLENKQNNVKESQSGKVTVKGDKYIVEAGDQKLISDGKTVWTILTKDKEVHVNPIDDDDDQTLNPSKLFTVWEKDFKYRFIKEETVGGQTLYEIHLFPEKPAKSKFHTVILKIDKAKSELSSLTIKGKEGDVLTYKLTKFTANPAVSDADFKFERSKYPGYTIID